MEIEFERANFQWSPLFSEQPHTQALLSTAHCAATSCRSLARTGGSFHPWLREEHRDRRWWHHVRFQACSVGNGSPPLCLGIKQSWKLSVSVASLLTVQLFLGGNFEFSNQDGQTLGKEVGQWALNAFTGLNRFSLTAASEEHFLAFQANPFDQSNGLHSSTNPWA